MHKTALKWAQILWSDTLANEASPPVAIYSEASDLHTCMAGQIHYQHFDIPMILHKSLTSFHLLYPPFIETNATHRGAHRPLFFLCSLTFLPASWCKVTAKTILLINYGKDDTIQVKKIHISILTKTIQAAQKKHNQTQEQVKYQMHYIILCLL